MDMSKFDIFLSTSNPHNDNATKTKYSKAVIRSPKEQLIDDRKAYNCEILLSRVKIPLPELMDHVLDLNESAMDAHLVDNLIKQFPTKEEMELLKGYRGEFEHLGTCDQFFIELMKVPRSETKFIAFSYKLQFSTKLSDLRNSLNNVYISIEQIMSSVKLKRVMKAILSLGDALNQGTADGAAVGFRLDSLLKLKEMRDASNNTTHMHYFCKVLAEGLPELLDFSKELSSLEPASKIKLKILAEEMKSITKGLEIVAQERKLCKKDGHSAKHFRKKLKKFLAYAEPEVKHLVLLHSGVSKKVDALLVYFGEDRASCSYESVVSTLHSFVRMFNQAHRENSQQMKAEKKAAQKVAEQEKEKEVEQEILKAAEQDKSRLVDLAILKLKMDDLDSDDLQAILLAMKKAVRNKYL